MFTFNEPDYCRCKELNCFYKDLDRWIARNREFILLNAGPKAVTVVLHVISTAY